MRSAFRWFIARFAVAAIFCCLSFQAAHSQDVFTLFDEARRLESQGQVSEALDRLDQAYQAASTENQRITIQVGMGWMLLKLERTEEAQKKFESALANGASSEERSRALVGLGIALYRQGKLPDALAKLEEGGNTSSSQENISLARLFAGEILASQGNLDLAQSRLEEAAERSDNTDRKAEALIQLGLVLTRRGMLDQAQLSLEQGSRLATTRNTQAYALRAIGDNLWANCRIDEAEEKYRQGLERAERPELRAQLFIGLGNVLSDRNQDQESLSMFQRGLESAESPDTRFILLYNIGQSELSRGLLAEAQARFKQALSLAPNRESELVALIGISDVLLRQGKVNEAKANYKKILEGYQQIQRENSDPDFRGSALIDASSILVGVERKPNEALKALQEGLQLVRNVRRRAGGLISLGDLEERLHHREKALEYYMEASKLACGEQQRAEALLGAGAALRQLGRADEAVASLKEGLSHTSDPASIKFGRLNLANLALYRNPRYLILVIAVVILLLIGGMKLLHRISTHGRVTTASRAWRRRAMRMAFVGAIGAVIGTIPTMLFDYFYIDTSPLVIRGSVMRILNGSINGFFAVQFLRIEFLSALLAVAILVTIVAADWRGRPGALRKVAATALLAAGFGLLGVVVFDLLWYGLELHPRSLFGFASLLSMCTGGWGLLIGLAAGFVYGARRCIVQGAIGGLLGGILGGAIFYPTYVILLDLLPFDDIISYSGLLQNILLGASIALALALLDLPARSASETLAGRLNQLLLPTPHQNEVAEAGIAIGSLRQQPQESWSISVAPLEINVIRAAVAEAAPSSWSLHKNREGVGDGQ